MAIALLSASLSFVVGLVAGAAIQRWGDAERATHGHTRTPEPTGYLVGERGPETLLTRRPGYIVTDWGPMQ